VRILLCHPGASYATSDVFDGLRAALEAAGVEVRTYDLESRLELAVRWTKMVWRRAGKPDPKPSEADIVYWASKDIVERALRWNVDGVLIVSAMYLHPDLLVLLRRAKIRTAMVLTESPYDDERQERVLPWVDLAWTNERSSVPRLRRINPDVNYLPHAYDPSTHHAQATTDVQPEHEVVFVGSLFSERGELLSRVDWSGIDLALYGDWRGLPSRHQLRQYVRSDVIANAQSAALYRRCKIGLNLYRESIGFGLNAPRIDHAESLNPRAIELAACGCFQISHYRAEVAEVFGDAVPTFKTADELGQLVRHYLASPSMRLDKARRARQAIRGHTFAAMAATILTDLAQAGWPVHSKETLQWLATTGEKAGSMPQSVAPAPLSLSPV